MIKLEILAAKSKAILINEIDGKIVQNNDEVAIDIFVVQAIDKYRIIGKLIIDATLYNSISEEDLPEFVYDNFDNILWREKTENDFID